MLLRNFKCEIRNITQANRLVVKIVKITRRNDHWKEVDGTLRTCAWKSL